MMFKISTSAIIISSMASFAQAIAHKHQTHESGKEVEGKNISTLFKRSTTCSFPTDRGLVAVQVQGKNAGWAMHYDQECTAGSWCPYACPPGQLMGQWDPTVTSYSYPSSQYGGLWCDHDGVLQEENTGKSCCYSGKGTFIAVNKLDSNVAICQTVLPGNEEMLIPTNVKANSNATLAVPGTDYWAGTAAHYYINPPSVSVEDGCKWGSTDNPHGNWAPYVAGANQDDNDKTYTKIGWNPVYLESDSPFKDTKPSFGIRLTCDNEAQCVGLPCSIDPNVNDINGATSDTSAVGAGGASFCVVTANNGAKVNIEVFGSSSTSKFKRYEHEHGHEGKRVETIETRTIFKTVATQS